MMEPDLSHRGEPERGSQGRSEAPVASGEVVVVDVWATGTPSPFGGLALYCREARLGKLYSKPEDRLRVLASLLRQVSERLGKQAVLGTLHEETATQQAEFVEGAGERLVNKTKRKSKARQTHWEDWE